MSERRKSEIIIQVFFFTNIISVFCMPNFKNTRLKDFGIKFALGNWVFQTQKQLQKQEFNTLKRRHINQFIMRDILPHIITLGDLFFLFLKMDGKTQTHNEYLRMTYDSGLGFFLHEGFCRILLYGVVEWVRIDVIVWWYSPKLGSLCPEGTWRIGMFFGWYYT